MRGTESLQAIDLGPNIVEFRFHLINFYISILYVNTYQLFVSKNAIRLPLSDLRETQTDVRLPLLTLQVC